MLSHLESRLGRTLQQRERQVLARPEKTVAAVLVPLLDIDGEPHLLYTRRSASLPHHQGQIAFPGGTVDATDPDLRHTALREAEEEIGLAPARVRILGALDDLETMASRFLITPYVGLVAPPYEWRPSPHEVDCVFTVSLDRLRHPDNRRTELWDFDGTQVPIDLFHIDGHVIWGATHRITRNLLQLLENDG